MRVSVQPSQLAEWYRQGVPIERIAGLISRSYAATWGLVADACCEQMPGDPSQQEILAAAAEIAANWAPEERHARKSGGTRRSFKATQRVGALASRQRCPRRLRNGSAESFTFMHNFATQSDFTATRNAQADRD
jgi:hypothetical protein